MKLLLTSIFLCLFSMFSFSQIIANDDYVGPVDGVAGNPNVGNVFLNDLLNGGPVSLASGTITYNNFGPIVINPNGTIAVLPNTPSGTYTMTYTLCENANLNNCDVGVVTVTVINNSSFVDSNDDTFGPVLSNVAPSTVIGNVLSNDLYNGLNPTTNLVILTNTVSAVPLFPGAEVPFLDFNTGSIVLPFGTPNGTYTLQYIICDIYIPTNCDVATITVVVGPSPVTDLDDLFSISNITLPASAGNILSNSTINGATTTMSDVTITVDSPADPINLGDPVPELDVLTGDINVPSATPVGVYYIGYTLTDLNLNSVSSTATIFVFEPSTGISGTVYTDGNTNCIFDGTDVLVPNQLVKLYDAGNNLVGQAYTDANGDFLFNLPAGQYSVNLASLQAGTSVTCPLSGNYSVNVVNGAMNANTDFALECNQSNLDVNVYGIYHWNWVFPGQTHTLAIGSFLSNGYLSSICNLNGPATGTMTITVSGPVDFSSIPAGSITPDNITGTTFTYSIADFSSINFYSFTVNLQTQTTAQIGDLISVTATYTPSSTDANLTNNTLTYTYPVVNSYDPNMKEVSPPGDVLVGFEDDLIYTIYFQNLGNAPAFNINLKDTLSSNLDLESFEKMGSSHYCEVDILGNAMEVNFPNIMLADSASNPEGSIGYFQYRIKPLTGLSQGASIQNTAHIFFDFNPAIVTNTVVTNYIEPPMAPIATVTNTCGSSILTADGSNLLWSTGDTTSTISVTSAGTYTVTQTAQGFESLPTTIVAAPIAIPVEPSVTVTNDCGSSTLSASGSNLVWSTTETSSSIIVTDSGIFTITQTENGCESPSAWVIAAPLELPQVAFASLTTVCENYVAFDLTQGSPVGGIYSGNGVTGNQFDPSEAGTGSWELTYTYTDMAGCENSASSTLIVDACASIEENNMNFRIYPNPTVGDIFIESSKNIDSYHVYDNTGRVLLVGETKYVNVLKLDLSFFKNGSYYLHLQSSDEVEIFKIIVAE